MRLPQASRLCLNGAPGSRAGQARETRQRFLPYAGWSTRSDEMRTRRRDDLKEKTWSPMEPHKISTVKFGK